jgi:hypothetical protein
VDQSPRPNVARGGPCGGRGGPPHTGQRVAEREARRFGFRERERFV